MRIVFWTVAIPFLAAAGAFAAANHQPLTLNFWPLPFTATVPVYAAVLGPLFLGLFLSGLWFSFLGLRDRLASRRLARHEQALEEETARLKRELAQRNRIPPAPVPSEDDKARRLVASDGG